MEILIPTLTHALCTEQEDLVEPQRQENRRHPRRTRSTESLAERSLDNDTAIRSRRELLDYESHLRRLVREYNPITKKTGFTIRSRGLQL